MGLGVDNLTGTIVQSCFSAFAGLVFMITPREIRGFTDIDTAIVHAAKVDVMYHCLPFDSLAIVSFAQGQFDSRSVARHERAKRVEWLLG